MGLEFGGHFKNISNPSYKYPDNTAPAKIKTIYKSITFFFTIRLRPPMTPRLVPGHAIMKASKAPKPTLPKIMSLDRRKNKLFSLSVFMYTASPTAIRMLIIR